MDPTFDPAIAAGSSVRILQVLADGKILIGNFTTLRLLNSDGSQVWGSPTCSTSFAIPLADGSFLASGCRKWTSGTAALQPQSSKAGRDRRSIDGPYLHQRL